MTTQRTLLWLCVALLVAGCMQSSDQPKFHTALRGRLLNNGKPVAVDQEKYGFTARVELCFVNVDTGKEYPVYNVNPDGSFELRLPEGEEFQPGKYKVIARQIVPSDVGETDLLGGKYTAENSRAIVEITDPTDLEIDLAKIAPADTQGSSAAK